MSDLGHPRGIPELRGEAVGSPVPSSSRRFGLGDGLILIAGLAAAFGVIRVNSELGGGVPWSELGTLLSKMSWDDRLQVLPSLIASEVAGPVYVGAATMLVMRLRRPRPRLARLARQPGFVACVAAPIALAVGAAILLGCTILMLWLRGPSPLNGIEYLTLIYLQDINVPVGFAVLGAWLSLALGRRWRAEPTWLDRGGRLIGVLCVIAGLARVLSGCVGMLRT